MPAKDTKERILDTAERLFADHGFGDTSLRRITTAAEVNLAAVHYHFGSKEALIEAIFVRRLGPLNRERLELLDEMEKRSGDGGPSLEQIVEAFVGPALRMRQDAERGGEVFMRLLGHTISQPSNDIRQLFIGQFRHVLPRFIAALKRQLPDLSETEVFWRFLFMIGAMAYTMAMSNSIPMISNGLCDSGDAEGMIQRLVPFLVAGLQAPLPARTDESRE